MSETYSPGRRVILIPIECSFRHAKRNIPAQMAFSKQYRDAECVMDWNRIEGNWKQFKGKAKEKWGRLTDDDLDVINGRQDQLEGRIQERYGLAKDQAKKDVETWFRSLP
jgi:uncharacterized protein YjbJ (UPF0337 family)